MKTTLAIIAILALPCCETRPLKPCNVERVCFRDRAETHAVLRDHPAWAMDALKTIALLENEAGGYE